MAEREYNINTSDNEFFKFPLGGRMRGFAELEIFNMYNTFNY